MLKKAQAIESTVIGFRHQIHQYPELAFEEHRTADLIAQRLTELGIAVRTGVAKTGVVGDLGEGSRCIALRADMDALPIQEENDAPYASKIPGVMHACGHDVHVACLLGVAEILAQEHAAGRLPGRVRFLFQPSEENQDSEGLSGGMRMAQEGVMDGVDGIVGMHIWTGVPAGKISTRVGALTAHPDKFTLVIKGQESHGAYPHEGFDAIAISAQVINALQTVISRRLDPTRGRVLTVGTIHGGAKDNIMAGQVTMTGTIRTFEPETRQQLLAEMERACGVARALGGDYELDIVAGYHPVVNDPGMTALVQEVATDLLGPQNVLEAPQEMGGEDFSYLARQAPGCFFWLGGALADGPKRLHHHPKFDIDEQALPLGVALLAETVIRFLQAGDR